MTTLRIYADFNGLVSGPSNPSRVAVVLDTFGSVRDLANAGVLLHPGLPLIAVDWSDEAEDLEGHGTAQFDWKRGWWVVEFDELGVRYVPAGDRTENGQFLCLGCRNDVGTAAATLARARAENRCPKCGEPLDSPIRPPPR